MDKGISEFIYIVFDRRSPGKQNFVCTYDLKLHCTSVPCAAEVNLKYKKGCLYCGHKLVTLFREMGFLQKVVFKHSVASSEFIVSRSVYICIYTS